jgi:hypothetical protein
MTLERLRLDGEPQARATALERAGAEAAVAAEKSQETFPTR